MYVLFLFNFNRYTTRYACLLWSCRQLKLDVGFSLVACSFSFYKLDILHTPKPRPLGPLYAMMYRRLPTYSYTVDTGYGRLRRFTIDNLPTSYVARA